MGKSQLFLVGQKAFIEKDDHVLVLKHKIGKIDFPGGKIDEGETDLNQSLVREVHEETGLEITVSKPFYRWTFEYNPQHPRAGQKVFLIGIKCIYKSGKIQLEPEHINYVWVNKDNYKEVDDGTGHFKALDAYFHLKNSL